MGIVKEERLVERVRCEVNGCLSLPERKLSVKRVVS